MAEEPVESPLFCDRCGKELHSGQGNFYVVNIEAMADPAPPTFSTEDLSRDHQEEFSRLFAELEGLSERELMDQVYRRVTIFLCDPCYREWIENPAG
jgi:hypothetical protein